jgi:hypothetical protein
MEHFQWHRSMSISSVSVQCWQFSLSVNPVPLRIRSEQIVLGFHRHRQWVIQLRVNKPPTQASLTYFSWSVRLCCWHDRWFQSHLNSLREKFLCSLECSVYGAKWSSGYHCSEHWERSTEVAASGPGRHLIHEPLLTWQGHHNAEFFSWNRTSVIYPEGNVTEP